MSGTMGSEADAPTHCRILQLEDSDLDAELIAERLQVGGLRVEIERVQTERGFTEALTPSHTFDVILADRTLPDFDGITALAIARDLAPDLPFIFVSGTLGEEQAIDAVKAGATDYVLKHRLQRLSVVVRRALAERVTRLERQAAEAALRVTEARLARLLRTIPVGVVEIDADANFVYANAPAERILGAPAGGLLGKSYADHAWRFCLDDGAAMPLDGLPALRGLRGETVSNFQHTITTVDGRSVVVLVDVVPVWDEAGDPTGALVTFQDVTSRNEQAKALREKAEQLEQAQKMDALGQLTGGIAHDFNNMLQAIGGGLDLVQLRLKHRQIEPAARSAADAQKTVERAAALSERLLAFARRQPLQPVPVEVDGLIADLVELVQRAVGPAIDVRVALNARGCIVSCDPHQLENVLLNLSINARDAMPAGGTLVFATKTVQLRERELRASQKLAPGGYVEISITDTGIGMNEATRARAFEPFFTTKPAGQGTGLGLSQTHGFVHQSGGGLDLESALGGGTTVRLFLPQHTTRPQHTTEAMASGLPQMAAPATVLLVEDEEKVRLVLAERLRADEYEVFEAEDGHAALSLLKSGVAPDLLVTDVGLPSGLDGRQTAEAARALRPELPVLFITGYAGSVLKDPLARGMEIMGKPFSLDSFIGRVQDVLYRHRPTSTSAPASS
jgi:PAS domain S-box-containing protein